MDVVYVHGLDPLGWSRRHDAGQVPSRWPYGLDGLADAASAGPDEVGVVPVVAPPYRRVAARLRRVGAALPTVRPRTLLVWEENTFACIAPVRRGVRAFVGVIWLTDLDPESETVRRRVPLLRGADGLWVLSTAQVEPLQRLLGPGGPPVHVVAFGVDEEFFTPAPYPRRPMVVSAGGDRDRDPATLYEAMADVLREAPETRVVIQTRSALPAPRGVEVVPSMSHTQLRDLYREASVVTVATRLNLHASGMTVVLEAMATARPVVITGTPGLEDYVQHDVTGLLAHDPESLAASTLGLLRDPQRAADLGRAGRSAVEARFTTALLSDRLARLSGLSTSTG